MPTRTTTVFEGIAMQELLERPAEPKRAEALRDARSALLAGVLAGEPLLEWLKKLTLALEQTLPGLMGSVLLLEGDRLRLAAAPSLPESYNRLVDNHAFGEGMGSCGTAAFRAQMVVVSDIQSDPLWKNYRDVARRFGLGACWSMPFFDRSKRVKGTVAVYSREPRRPLEDELAVIREFAMVAAVGFSHHRLEDRVRAGQAKFDELVDDLDVIVWRGGPEGRRPSHVGRTIAEALGHPLAHWREGELWHRHIHPEDRESIVRQYEQAARQGTGYESEYRAIAADGSTVWLRDVVQGAGPTDGGFRLHGVTANITRQRAAGAEREQMLERALSEQARLKGIIAHLPKGLLLVEADTGRVVACNQQAEGLLEAGKHLPLSRVLARGEVVLNERVSYLRANGARRHLSMSAAPVRDGTGAVVAGIALVADVSESIEKEKAARVLAEAGAKLGSSLDPAVTLDGVVAVTTAELADWCAIFLTHDERVAHLAAVSMRDPSKAALKAELERLAPQPGGVPFQVSEVITTGRARLFASVDPEIFEPGAVKGDLLRVVHALGTESAMTIPLRGQGRILGAIVCGSAERGRRYEPRDLDLGEELGRRAGTALENAQLYDEARGAVRHREEFLSIAAHELKTPLAGLQLALETLVLQLARPTPDLEVVRGRGRASQRHTARLVRLIEELLDVSSVRAGRMQLSRERIDLVEAAKAVLARFRDELKAKGLDVLLHAPAPVVGHWDPRRLDQVITNLLSNAIKYGDGQPVRIYIQGDKTRANLRIEDYGIGMSPELMRRIFRPFERGVAAGHYGGLGLGLHITAQIVRAHGGTITVDSRPDEGSAFTVDLPCDDEAA